jgi:hypothetical protein
MENIPMIANGVTFEAIPDSEAIIKFIGKTITANHIRGIQFQAGNQSRATLAQIDQLGDRNNVRIFHGEWTDFADDGHVLWTGTAQVAVPLADDEPRIVVVADDFSRLKMDYEIVVNGLAAA